jgi:hypothetical protein
MKDPETVARIVHLTAAVAYVRMAMKALEESIAQVGLAVPSDHPCVKPIETAHLELLKSDAILASTVKRLRK